MDCVTLVRLISLEELCLNRVSPLSISPKPVKVTAVSLHSPNPGRGSLCSFVRNRENRLTNLGLSPKLCKWKPVTTHTRLSSFATDLFPEASLKWRAVSAVHIHGGWDGECFFSGPRRACLPWQESYFFLQSKLIVIVGEVKSTVWLSVMPILPHRLWPPWSLEEQKMWSSLGGFICTTIVSPLQSCSVLDH